MRPKLFLIHTFSILLISFLFLPLLMPTAAQAAGPTYVSGTIITNTTWSLANSPYIVKGNILVNSGVTLTIEPGVEVKFDGNYALNVNGALDAQGTAVEMIKFTSNKATPRAGDWDTIYFSDSSDDSRCIISYARIEYGRTGVYADIASPRILNNQIEKHINYGIYIWGGSSSIQNNTIQNTDYGIYVLVGSPSIQNNTIQNVIYGIYVVSGSPSIQNNTIQNNSTGIYFLSGSTSSVTGNTITNNGYGISLSGDYFPQPVINNNSLYGNTSYEIYLYSYYDNSAKVINAENNWWGTTDPVQIAAKIYDYNERSYNPTVDFTPFLDGPIEPTVAMPGIWIVNYTTIRDIFSVNPILPMEDVIVDLQRMGVATVFLHTGGRGVTGPGQFFSEFPQANLARFLSLAHQAGLKVHAYCVDSHGSQQFLDGRNDGSFIRAVGEVTGWNNSHTNPEEDFDGIHLDIEDGLVDSDAQPLVDLYIQIDGLIGNLEFSAAVDAKTPGMSPTERGMDYAQLSVPLDLIVPMAYIMDKGFWFDPVRRGQPQGDFNYVNDVYLYTQDAVGTNCAIGLGMSASDRIYALDWLGNELARSHYLTNLWDREEQYSQDMYSLKYNPNFTNEGTDSYISSGLELFRLGVISPSGFKFKYGDPRDQQYIMVPQDGHLAVYQTTQDSLKESIRRFPDNYCFWNYDSIYHSRRMGLFTTEVDVEPDSTSVPQGGTLRIRVALTNHLDEPVTFKLTADVTEPDPAEPPYFVKKVIYEKTLTLSARQGLSRYVTYPISRVAVLGNWILTATVEGLDSNIYDQDSFDFKVTPALPAEGGRRLQFGPSRKEGSSDKTEEGLWNGQELEIEAEN